MSLELLWGLNRLLSELRGGFTRECLYFASMRNTNSVDDADHHPSPTVGLPTGAVCHRKDGTSVGTMLCV